MQSKFQLGPLLGNCPKTLTAFFNYTFSPESWKNKKWLPQHEELRQARTTGSSRTTCCSWHHVMLPAVEFGTRKCLLILSLVKPRQNTDEITKTYKLFIYGDTHYTDNSLGIPCRELHIYTCFLLISVHIYYKRRTEKKTQVQTYIQLTNTCSFCNLCTEFSCCLHSKHN